MWARGSTDDLVEKARNSTNPAARCYAFEHLCEQSRADPEIKEFLPELITKCKADTEICTYFAMSGCCVYQASVSDITSNILSCYDIK